ncbi:MAG: hypothetical protein NTY53_23965 [Kiritimatiellaeota bacterium]|nr:hypothetical protein [Kiritimatiellota bacterium]
MSGKKAIASAIVKVEVKVDSVWGLDCNLSQVEKQAQEGAAAQILRAIADHKDLRLTAAPKITISLVDTD